MITNQLYKKEVTLIQVKRANTAYNWCQHIYQYILSVYLTVHHTSLQKQWFSSNKTSTYPCNLTKSKKDYTSYYINKIAIAHLKEVQFEKIWNKRFKFLAWNTKNVNHSIFTLFEPETLAAFKCNAYWTVLINISEHICILTTNNTQFVFTEKGLSLTSLDRLFLIQMNQHL